MCESVKTGFIVQKPRDGAEFSSHKTLGGAEFLTTFGMTPHRQECLCHKG